MVNNFKNKSIGQIRLQYLAKSIYEIDIYIDREFRKNGIAKTALNMVENKLLKNSIIFADVRKNNIRSYKFFLKCNL